MENRSFYNEILTEHNIHPEFKHDLPDANIELEGVNPSCGDDITLKLKAGTNMTNAPFFWNTPSKTACLNIASALPGAMKIAFRSAPAAGTVVAAGADYTLTENDLNNLTSLTEGVRFALVNGQIVTAE